MKRKIITTLLIATVAITSYTLGTQTTTPRTEAKTEQISANKAIPFDDISGYFYNKYGYLCFEIGDTYINTANGKAYDKICQKFSHLTDVEDIQTYPTTAKVVKVNRKKNVVTVKDYNGNKWKFRGCEDYMKGDVVSMLMDSNGTEKISDDVILQVRYSGR